jgi:hypothetical protein
MACMCGSDDLGSFRVEISFPRVKNTDERQLLARELVVCLTCGLAQFLVPEPDLRLLAKVKGPSGYPVVRSNRIKPF